jgi:hypothetical protein
MEGGVARQYAVDGVRDDQGALLNKLTEIARSGGRVVSVTWQPQRDVRTDRGGATISSGFTVVSEYDFPDA